MSPRKSDGFEEYVSERSKRSIEFLEEFVADGWGVDGLEGNTGDSLFSINTGSISAHSDDGHFFQLFGGSRPVQADPEAGVTGGADGLLYHTNIRSIDEYNILKLDLCELRSLCKYLTDVIMMPDTRIGGLGPDHLAYWAWTADFAHYTLVEKYEKEVYHGLLLDFETLIDFVLMAFQQRRSPQIPPSLLTSGLRFAGGAGFPILEGLLRRRCNEISLDGSLQFASAEKQLVVPGRRDSLNNDRKRPIQLDHLLHIWKDSGATEEVQNILGNLDREYSGGQICKKFPDVNQKKLSQGFFRVLYDQRNYNLHGDGSTQTVGAVLLNLCSLVIWDVVTETEFAEAGNDFEGKRTPKATLVRTGMLPWTE